MGKQNLASICRSPQNAIRTTRADACKGIGDSRNISGLMFQLLARAGSIAISGLTGQQRSLPEIYT